MLGFSLRKAVNILRRFQSFEKFHPPTIPMFHVKQVMEYWAAIRGSMMHSSMFKLTPASGISVFLYLFLVIQKKGINNRHHYGQRGGDDDQPKSVLRHDCPHQAENSRNHKQTSPQAVRLVPDGIIAQCPAGANGANPVARRSPS